MIRLAEEDDLDAIVALFRAWWDEEHGDHPHAHPGPSREAQVEVGHPIAMMGTTVWIEPDRAALRDRLRPYFFIAEEDGHPVGFAYGRRRRVEGTEWWVFPDGGDLFELSALYVVPGSRRSGLGSALVSHTLEAAGSDGSTQLFLQSSADPAILRFYERHGFGPYHVYQYRRD